VFPDLAGWTVAGRHGALGRVLSSGPDSQGDASASLLVRGGTTEALYYHVPVSLVTGIAVEERVVEIDADIDDFAPHLRPDGSVDLFPVER
jgi:hypothetical protein